MNEDRKKIIDFDEYIRQGEPEKREKAYIWQTAIGLQAVDGLTTSDYLNETAKRHIEGEIDIDEVRELIKTYYQSKSSREPDDDEKQEADGVSANISKILIHWISVPRDTLHSIAVSLPAYSNMLAEFVTTISRKKSGCWRMKR